jgi:DNA-binding winged helix-turn-helix (wHTH) protein
MRTRRGPQPGSRPDGQISALRRTLGDSADAPRLLHTIRGVGFMLDAPPDPPKTRIYTRSVPRP